jgi:hypothetical protein
MTEIDINKLHLECPKDVFNAIDILHSLRSELLSVLFLMKGFVENPEQKDWYIDKMSEFIKNYIKD